MEARVAVLEQIARANLASLERIERRIETLGDQLGRRIDDLSRRIDTVEATQRSDFRWLLGVIIGLFGTMIAGFAGLLAVMAHGFHWL